MEFRPNWVSQLRDAQVKMELARTPYLSRGLDAVGETSLVFGEAAKVALRLYPMPERIRLPEERSKAYRHGRGDGSSPMHNLVYRAWRDTDSARHGVLRNAHGLQVLFEQDFAGGDGREHGRSPLGVSVVPYNV